MDLKNLSTFVQVAESGSFTRAGEKLGYSQPTVSIQIKQLERELGVKLFDRIGHTVRLTDRGRTLLSRAQRICHLCQEMARGGEEAGEGRCVIRLGMADSLCTALVRRGFAGFCQTHPNIAVQVRTGGIDELFRLLDHNEVDLVCTLDSHIYNTNYVIAHEKIIGVHFVLSAGDPLAEAEKLTQEDLLTQTFLMTERGMSYRRLLDEWLARDSKEIQPILEVGNADLICQMVEQGAGISFLPDYVTEEAACGGRVVRQDAEGFEPELWMQLIYHRDKWVSPQMQAVIRHLSDILL